MKNRIKLAVVTCLLVSVGLINGCGGGDGDNPQGKVVKGPVVGATVKDSAGNVIGTTDVNGHFPLKGVGPYTSTGGTYVPLKDDGTAGAPVAAPPMSCPVDVYQITPISTLVQTATAAAAKLTATTAERDNLTKLLAVVAKNGGLSVDLSTKTAANAALLTLSETVGAVLTTANATSATAYSTATTALITEVAKVSTAAPITTAAITTTVNNAITTVAVTIPSVAGALTTAATTATNGAVQAPINTPLPTYTGTGGSGGGGF